ncbi:MAG: hypothetical protein AAB403_04415 [Planctomycetota bacterium]
MADYESDLIKPVKSLQNVAGLAAAKQREERKRRQQLHEEQDDSGQNAETLPQKKTKNENNRDGTQIDYCA